ncbi:GUN4 domain-containing protein [Microcoleus sp. PH2017_30_WIL_O_A]|uniref:caspase, EACC1-associated type n=1 Tax=Microcoleus sp. PH2017_30_WIL_O_A TaxID=2798840 RepID=UPI001D25BADE|nr:GUN4 domain-containing protein [Microcoleus sp. PH2017_30_WIL_O_A]MCC3584261.1 GUN4 domain-containing protein [Microcoleus sp. PH2017_30_WIL_O_A]
MAKKVALLVGVSNYQQGLSALPSATKDAKAIKQVLQHPDIGGFVETDITSVLNQPQNRIEDAIYRLFNNCSSDDLVLFYFSGHGVKDEKGNLYIATPTTRTDQNKRVLPYTAISASFVKDQMTASPSRRQVVILDCCFSGAFAKGLTLGNKSWAVLTSSDTVEYSYAPEPSELSIYTRYLVEGIKTGVGDLNNDGNISVDELYEYTKKKVKEISPKMNPLLDNGRAGYKIVLAKSLQDDPKLKYRKEAERIASQEEKNFTSLNIIYEGSITDNSNRTFLDVLQKSLNLTNEDAKTIETEVLAPFRLRKDKLKNYSKVFAEAIKQSNPLSQGNRQNLKVLQQVLNLIDEDVEQIEKRVLDSLQTPPITNQPPTTTIEDIIGANLPQTPESTRPNKTQAASNPSSGNKNLGTSKPSENVSTVKYPINSKYTQLRDLLAAKKWKEADKETANVMLEAYSRESSGYLSAEDNIKKLPTEVLQTINQLWVKHSGGHFGFSIQKEIYLEVSKDYDKLGDRLGWKKEGKWLHWRELNFSKQAPKGHLPSGICPLGTVEGLIWDGYNVTQVLLNRNDLSS